MNEQPAPTISLKVTDRHLLIRLDAIVSLDGDGNYTYVHRINRERFLAALTMKVMYERVAADPALIRIHKKTVVNLRYVTALHLEGHPEIELIDGRRVRIAERRFRMVVRCWALWQAGLWADHLAGDEWAGDRALLLQGYTGKTIASARFKNRNKQLPVSESV